LYNTNAAVHYVKLYNKTSAPASASDTPVRTIGVLTGGKATLSLPCGMVFGTGIGIAVVTGSADTDNTSVGAGDITGAIDFK